MSDHAYSGKMEALQDMHSELREVNSSLLKTLTSSPFFILLISSSNVLAVFTIDPRDWSIDDNVVFGIYQKTADETFAKKYISDAGVFNQKLHASREDKVVNKEDLLVTASYYNA